MLPYTKINCSDLEQDLLNILSGHCRPLHLPQPTRLVDERRCSCLWRPFAVSSSCLWILLRMLMMHSSLAWISARSFSCCRWSSCSSERVSSSSADSCSIVEQSRRTLVFVPADLVRQVAAPSSYFLSRFPCFSHVELSATDIESCECPSLSSTSSVYARAESPGIYR